ncbi:MAG: ABC transporter permease, partial [bacterium]
MTRVIVHSLYMTQRNLMSLFRQPAWIFISLVQPVVWLLLYGQLFRRIVEIPGFGAGSYIDFLTPGVVVMTALFSAGWSGMSIMDDIRRGVVDRFLVAPTNRGSVIWGRLMEFSLTAVVQSLIIIVLGFLIGAGFPGGFPGLVVLVVAAILLGVGIGALSNAVAILSRR